MGRLTSPYFEGTCILKPREHALKDGISSLSDEELLALILCTGTKKENVMILSKRFLDERGGLRGLFLNDYPFGTNGIKDAKLFRILAVREIMKRIPLIKDEPLDNIEKVFSTVKNNFIGLKNECCLILYLDKNRCLLKKDVFSDANINHVHIPMDLIIKSCLLLDAKFIIQVHNHPSKSLTPSNEDIEFAKSLNDRLNINRVLFLDSLIVDEEKCLSLRANRIPPFD